MMSFSCHSNNTISVPFAHDVLNHFSTLSYYKVNFNKSLTSDLGLSLHAGTHLKLWLTYTWAEKSISYLGITLTAKMSLLANANIKPLLSEIRKYLTHIAKTELSWVGKIASFEMLVLPKMLYIIRTLQVPPKLSHFSERHKKLKHFLWHGKRAYYSDKHFIQHRKVGGMGLPDIKDYLLSHYADTDQTLVYVPY